MTLLTSKEDRMSKVGVRFLYSLLAIIPLGIPIGLIIYVFRNKSELITKIKKFKLKK